MYFLILSNSEPSSQSSISSASMHKVFEKYNTDLIMKNIDK